MARFPTRFPERIAVCILGGLALAAASAVGFWAGSILRGAGKASSPRTLAAATSDRERLPDEAPSRPPGATPDPAPGGDEDRDDPAVFLALERLERRMEAEMGRARDSVVALEYTAGDGPPSSRRLATGVVINSSGDVLSVRIDPPASAPGILARDASGKRHAVQWVANDPETGLTLLRIRPNAVKPIVIAGEGPILGSQVFVVGNPFGLGHSVSRGHVAGLDRALKLGHRQVGGLIQVQAPLYPGDSGAVVTNLRGQLLGVIRSGLAIPAAPGDHAERDNDFGFAIGTRDLLWVADQLRARGRVDRAYLGVRLDTAAAPDGPSAGARPDGAYLDEVLSGTPAAKAGLRSGDAVIAVDGEPIHSSPDLTDRLDRLAAQATIRLEVLRGSGPAGQRLGFVVQTASRPAPEAPGQDLRPLASAAPLTIVPTAAPGMPREPGATAAGSAEIAAATLTTGPVSTRKPPPPAPAVAIPGTARSPLRAPVPPAQAEDLKLTVPRVVTERLDQFERRLEHLERQAVPGPPPRTADPRQTP